MMYWFLDLVRDHATLAQVGCRTDRPIGEKIVPLPQEGRITSDVRISGAVMFGRGKSQCGILIEPRKEYALGPHDEVAIAKFKEDIMYVPPSTYCSSAIHLQCNTGL